MRPYIKAIWNFILDIFFPIFCIGCQAEGKYLCNRCSDGIQVQAVREDFNSGLDVLIFSSEYVEKSLLAKLIHNYKYEFIEDLAEPLSAILGRTIIKHHQCSDVDAITFVPLHPKRERWRGFNQTRKLAETVAANLNFHCENLLQRKTFSVAQMELKKEQRAANVAGAFATIDGVKMPANILVIDDVATTLSTLSQCAIELKKAGAKKVTGLVLARVY